MRNHRVNIESPRRHVQKGWREEKGKTKQIKAIKHEPLSDQPELADGFVRAWDLCLFPLPQYWSATYRFVISKSTAAVESRISTEVNATILWTWPVSQLHYIACTEGKYTHCYHNSICNNE